MRSDEGGAGVDCEDEMVQLACAMESDECPAACRDNGEEEEEEEVVKSGDLEIDVEASEGRKVAYFAATNTASDLDTITLKASEAGISLNSITLERYGYANAGDITRVWLEDENGNEIAKPKPVGTKGTVTLSIKSDYRELDKSDVITIVVETDGAAASYDGTVAFKITDVDSSAKNVEIKKYTPHEYSFVSYGGSTVDLTWKGKADTYNYEEGASYDVAKFKLEAGNSPLTLNGFTLTNAAGAMDLEDNLADVEVLIAGEAVKGLEWSVDKKELKINFKDVEIASKANVMVTVNVTLVDTFEDFNEAIDLSIVKPSHINAVEKKTGSRVTLVGDVDLNGTTLAPRTAKTFNGGQIRLSGEKLGTVNAAAGSSEVVLAEGTITINGASVEFPALSIFAKTTPNAIVTLADAASTTIAASTVSDVKIFDELKLVINGETFDGNYNAAGAYVIDAFTLEKGGKFQIVADLLDSDDMTIYEGTTLNKFESVDTTNSAWKFDDAVITLTINGNGTAGITFDSSIFAKDAQDYFTAVKYADPDGKVAADDMIGTINLAKLKLSAAKGSLESATLKDVEYVVNESTKKTIYEGTYTAKNETVYLNNFSVESSTIATAADEAVLDAANMRFYLSIDGKEVSSTRADAVDTTNHVQTADDDFANVKVEAGKSVSVKLELEANPKADLGTEIDYTFTLAGENENTDPAGEVDDTTVKVDFVTAGSVNIVNYTIQDRVVKAGKNLTVAEFYVKPSNGAEGVYLNDLGLDVKDIEATPVATNYKVTVDGKDVDSSNISVDGTTKYLVVDGLNELLESAGIKVVVTYKGNLTASATKKTVRLVGVNKTTYATTVAAGSEVKAFNILAADGIVKIESQEDRKDETRLVFDVVTNNDYTVSNLKLTYASAPAGGYVVGNVSDEDFEDIANNTNLEYITQIDYTVNGIDYTITKNDFKDFFKVGDSYAKIFKTSND